MENMLSGKTAIITGASRGIGKTIAIALGREKMRLALLARSTDKLQEVVNEGRAPVPVVVEQLLQALFLGLHDFVNG